MVRILAMSIAIVVITIVIYFAYLFFTYIDAKHTEGEAYGFKIGDSKDIVYQKAQKVYDEEKVYILYPLDKNKYGPHKRIHLKSDEYQLIKNRDSWKLYFDEGFFDSMEFKFKDDTLISIYRHRKNFELP